MFASCSERAALDRFIAIKRRPDVLAAATRLAAVASDEMLETFVKLGTLAVEVIAGRMSPCEHRASIVKLAAVSSISLSDLEIMAELQLEQVVLLAAIAPVWGAPTAAPGAVN